ncbi:MAG: LptE family protein [Melioribacteraceae bacterium]|nr:LptE family protein [Melioribacteraceae bacterium]
MIYVRLIRLLSFTILAFLLEACSYSFTGASVPPHLNSISIPIVKDRSGSAEPNLSTDFTNELIQKFLDDNNLDVADKTSADALLECTITSLQDRAETVSGKAETATERRLTLNVKVVYKDLIKKQTILDKNFSNYATYSTTEDAYQARLNAVTELIDILTDDILLGVVSNW